MTPTPQSMTAVVQHAYGLDAIATSERPVPPAEAASRTVNSTEACNEAGAPS